MHMHALPSPATALHMAIGAKTTNATLPSAAVAAAAAACSLLPGRSAACYLSCCLMLDAADSCCCSSTSEALLLIPLIPGLLALLLALLTCRMLLLVLIPAPRMILVLLAGTICMASLPPMETVPHLPWGSVDAVERVQAGLPVVLTETGFVSGPVSTEWTKSYLATHWDKGASRPCHGLQTTLRTAAGRPLFYYTDRHERATYNLGRVRYATCVIDPRNGCTHTHIHTRTYAHTRIHTLHCCKHTHVCTHSHVCYIVADSTTRACV